MTEYVRCAFRAPARKSVELPGGTWYSREWIVTKGYNEKAEYEALVLTRPAKTEE
jgi:hypothetical protein